MKASLFISLLVISIQLSAQTTVIHCGHIIDGISDKIQKEVSITIEESAITKIEKGFVEVGEDEQFIDLSKAYVMPGFIDMHVHIESEYSQNSYLQKFTLDKADKSFQAVNNAKLTLEAGFTTIRDLGGSGVNTALRDAINKGIIVGPRIYSVNKSLAITGGHADPTNGYGEHILCAMPGPESGVCDGVEECMKAVRQQVKLGAD